MVCNAHTLEERCEFLILSTPVRLYSNDFLIEEEFNKFFEVTKLLEDIKFIL
jgi:hypothetical protein